jgi:hypothetical protein
MRTLIKFALILKQTVIKSVFEDSELDRAIKLLLEMKFQGVYYGVESVKQYNKYIIEYLPEALRRES